MPDKINPVRGKMPPLVASANHAFQADWTSNGINHSNNTETGPKKRVLFVITQSEMGGAQRFLHNLLSRLDKNRYEIMVSVSADGGGELFKLMGSLGITANELVHLKRNISPVKDILAVFELRKLIRGFRPDTLFLLSSKAGFIGSLAAKFQVLSSRFQVIYRIGGWSFNDPWPKWKKRLFITLERISARWKDVIIVNNKHDLEQACELKIKPRKEIKLIHNGLDVYKTEFLPREEARLKLFEKASKASGGVFQAEITVGTIANFYPPKGLKYLIEAAEHFKNNDNVIFMVIGDGQEREELELLITNYQLQHQVLLLGQIPDAYKLLTAFDIFVLPSVKEGFPWVVIEAMAAKLPVVATRVGAVPEIIEDGKNGFIVEPGQPEQIAAKIQDLLNDEHLRQELGIQAHQTVLFKFSLDKMIREITQLLDRL
ncbi:MAG TPA: glycosyltransferase family 4 protein [Candidatus Paceibacterota bacterium]|nr:glycosyltransferase family 4 protein [Candidatus Paceibacterota bacterium]